MKKEEQERSKSQIPQKDKKGNMIISKEVDMADAHPRALESKYKPEIKPVVPPINIIPLLSAKSRLRHDQAVKKDKQAHAKNFNNSPYRPGSLHHLSSFQSD